MRRRRRTATPPGRRAALRPRLVGAVLALAAAVEPATAALDGIRVRTGDVVQVGRGEGLDLGLTFDRGAWFAWAPADDHHYELGLVVLPRVQHGDALYGVRFGPAWRFRPDGMTPSTFLEFGVGVTWLSARRIGDHDIGSRGHFVTHALFGWRPRPDSAWHAGIRMRHTSNAGLARPNPGFDQVELEYGLRFGDD